MIKKTEEAIGWGVRVDGPHPYLAYCFSFNKDGAVKEVSESYHRAVRVALVPLAEWQRLKRLDEQS